MITSVGYNIELAFIICSKIPSLFTLIFSIFLLIKYRRSKSLEKTLIYYIKIELIVACMISSIAHFLPIVIKIEDEKQTLPLHYVCHIQALIFFLQLLLGNFYLRLFLQ